MLAGRAGGARVAAGAAIALLGRDGDRRNTCRGLRVLGLLATESDQRRGLLARSVRALDDPDERAAALATLAGLGVMRLSLAPRRAPDPS